MITIKTAKLQEMVARVVKGASNNKLIPLTGLMAIELKNNVLTLQTTDATNYLYIKDNVEGDDFYVVVPVEVFSKLIARFTCDVTKLEVTDNYLKVVGNGTYKIELPLDENGSFIKYPNPVDFDYVVESNDYIKRTTIETILTTEKSALAVTLENPCYTGYYAGDCVVATDTYKIASLAVKLFKTSKLISPEMMNLLSVMTADNIGVYEHDNKLLFYSPDCVVYGTVMEGIEDYAIDAINTLVASEFSSMCRLSKTTLLQVLDRLSLFVEVYDKNGIYLTFTKDGLMITSKASSGTEIIPYIESKDDFADYDYTCCIDITMLTSQIKSQIGDVVELYYGDDTAIKMIDGDCTQVIALLEDE